MDSKTLLFCKQHQNDDVRQLALQAKRYPDIDMKTAIYQIAGRQIALKKIPAWAAIDDIWYPVHLSMEQCSSEATASYKAQILKESHTRLQTLADLTGGFGIDCAFLSSIFQEVTYVERQESLCQIAFHNFPALGLNHIQVINGDAVAHLQSMQPVDWIFIDPARRDNHGGKTVAIEDCEPNLIQYEDLLLEKSEHIMVKLSPMLDFSLAVQQLKRVQDIYLISVHNECKELLLILGKEEKEAVIHCINLLSENETQSFCFLKSKEQALSCNYTPTLENYLYEPNASLLKGGCYRSLAHTHQLLKLHPNSHLYTSKQYIENFPGRCFEITGWSTFNKKEIRKLIGNEKKANLTIRNFPGTVVDLRKKLKISEGGDSYLFATTLANEEKVLIKGRKLERKV